jgi:hypothetical protein
VRIGSGYQKIERLSAHKSVAINIGAIRELKDTHDIINPRTTLLLILFPLSKRLAHVLLVDSTHDPAR